MKYTEIADELIANATALNDEVSSLAKLFSETAFLGDNRNFPHAHYGYLMACMGQIDLMSKCEWGPVEPPRNQTPRMQGFMERYLDAQKAAPAASQLELVRSGRNADGRRFACCAPWCVWWGPALRGLGVCVLLRRPSARGG